MMNKGQWAKKLSKQELSKRMSELAKKRHSKLSVKERKVHALKMLQARYNKKNELHTRADQ